MKLYRNYDGSGSAFGETSLQATVPNPDTVAAFASQRTADGALTVMVVSKHLSATTPATISLANFLHAGTAQVWQLTAANTITRQPDITVTGTSFTATLPAQSITLYVLPQRTAAPRPNPPTNVRIVR